MFNKNGVKVSNYILSVIIPTKDRYKYLSECLKSLVAINSDLLEIVVQDNTAENSYILNLISEMNNLNIKYFHTSAPCSQTQNYDYAISNSTGDYVIGIGDDDSITSVAIQICLLMKKYSVDACNLSMSGYYWPDVFARPCNKTPLSFDLDKPKVLKYNTKKVLESYLNSGMQDLKFLPRMYHSILSRRILDKIKYATGSFCPGPSPDMSNAVAAATFLDWHIMVKYPVIISGSAFNSAAGKCLRGEHKGKLSEVKQLPTDVENGWSSKVPKIWLANTIWPESALKALTRTGNSDLTKRLNFFPMYARIFLKHPEYRALVSQQLVTKTDYLKLALGCVTLHLPQYFVSILTLYHIVKI